MFKVGITGGIGSGKSYVSSVFKVLGIPVFNADVQAKLMMDIDFDLKNQIIHLFGQEAYANGELNSTYLSSIVFSDETKLELLNNIVHPATIRRFNQWVNEQQSPYVVKEAALFFESGTAADIDFMIGVSSPKYIRVQRVIQRDNFSIDDVQKRMDKQLEESIKMKLCDAVIVNDNKELILPQVVELHERFLALLGKTNN